MSQMCRNTRPLAVDISSGVVLSWLLNVAAACKCISGTDLLVLLYELLIKLSHPFTVY